MIRLLSPPGIVTGLVVSVSVVGGVLFGASAVVSAMLVREAVRRVQRR